MVKLLHLADLRLGGPLHVATDALLERGRAATRAALRRAVGTALREEADAVLVSGNLFDARYLSYDAEQFLTRQLARLDEAGVSCFYAAGPADPAEAPSREAPLDGPASLHRFDAPAPEGALLTDDDGRPLARVVGAGVRDPASETPPAGPFPVPEDDVPHVGVLPAALPEDGEERVPGALRRARPQTGRRYDYWALGGAPRHWSVPGDPENAWYAGPTVPRGPAHAGPQGGLLVTLGAEPAPQVAFRPFAPLCWADLTLDALDDVATRPELLRRAQRAFATVRPEHAGPAYLARFTLTGGCPMAPSLRDPGARRRLEAALTDHLNLEAAFLRLHRLTRPAQPDRHRDDPHVLRETLTLLDRAADDPALLRALAPGALAAAPPNKGDRKRYLRERLAALDREACARLLREGQGT
jgi:hypothetical protein